jgi:hypothetical protein
VARAAANGNVQSMQSITLAWAAYLELGMSNVRLL